VCISYNYIKETGSHALIETHTISYSEKKGAVHFVCLLWNIKLLETCGVATITPTAVIRRSIVTRVGWGTTNAVRRVPTERMSQCVL
jgi:hypothetical protein